MLDVLLALCLFLLRGHLINLILDHHVGVARSQVVEPKFRVSLIFLRRIFFANITHQSGEKVVHENTLGSLLGTLRLLRCALCGWSQSLHVV